MNLILLYATSLVVTFISWYLCVIVREPIPRGILRATIVALLCAPGILIGHGIGVAPTVFALHAQPSFFTFGSILIAWLIVVGIIFSFPAQRNDRSKWPPSMERVFLDAYWIKFAFFGVVAATLMYSLTDVERSPAWWVVSARYGLFFGGAISNLALCYWATRSRRVNPIIAPVLFSAPVLLVAAPTVALMWYGGGAIGGLIGSGRRHSACWLSLGVFSLLFLNSSYRIYAAINAPEHVTIGGGVAGNAAMAGVFAVLAILPWLVYSRPKNGEPRL